MPGIVGGISERSPDECLRMVERMLGSMRYETFYTQAVHPDYDRRLRRDERFAVGRPAFPEPRRQRHALTGEKKDHGQWYQGQVSRRTDRSGASSASSLPDLYEVRGDGTRKA